MQSVKAKPIHKLGWAADLLKSIWPLFAGMVFVFFYSRDPALTELGYSASLYPMLVTVTSFAGRLLYISVTELFYGASALLIIVMAVTYCLNIRKAKRKERGGMIFSAAMVGLKTASFVYLAFAVLCAPNYHRQPFSYHSGHEVVPSSANELAHLTEILAQRANDAGAEVYRGENGAMLLSARNIYEVASAASGVMKNLAQTYPVLGLSTPQPKPVGMSFILSHLGLSGFYFPFFSEANVNIHMPAVEIPFTMLHELAHAQGFMREEEANFIAYLACRDSDNPDFAYSANLMALRYCLNALYGADSDAYKAVWDSLSDSVKSDIIRSGEYWRSFEGTLSEVSNAVNDAYLKVNSQSLGVRSYGAVVDLLLAEYRTWPEAMS